MLDRPIAVLGGGNAAHAHAAVLTLGGYDVNFYEHPEFEDVFKTTLENGTVEVEEESTGRCGKARIHKITTDMKVAISDAKLIFLLVPSFAQELFFNTMIPYLKDGQVVFIWTGNFGALRLRRLLREKACNVDITIYETATCPFASRLTGPGKVGIHRGFGPWLSAREAKASHLFAALPAQNNNVAVNDFLKLYPLFSLARNVLLSTLTNRNFIGHPAASLLNAGRIEYAYFMNQDFRLHLEGHTPSVLNVETCIANEMNALIKALGGDTLVPPDYMKGLADHQKMVPLRHVSLGPRTLKDRYITEDVPYGLVPMSELGKKLGVLTPIMDNVITLLSVMNEEDYRKTGRTLESIGLDELNKDQIINVVEKGDSKSV